MQNEIFWFPEPIHYSSEAYAVNQLSFAIAILLLLLLKSPYRRSVARCIIARSRDGKKYHLPSPRAPIKLSVVTSSLLLHLPLGNDLSNAPGGLPSLSLCHGERKQQKFEFWSHPSKGGFERSFFPPPPEPRVCETRHNNSVHTKPAASLMLQFPKGTNAPVNISTQFCHPLLLLSPPNTHPPVCSSRPL